MLQYRHSSDCLGVIRLPDNLFVSFDDADENKPQFIEWLEAGNLPLPPEYTLDELQTQNADAPVQPLGRALEWYEDSRVGEPAIVGGQWVRPVLAIDLRSKSNLAELKQRLRAKLADVRWQNEVGGTTFNGVALETDDKAQQKITGAYAKATADPAATVDWKTAEGFVELDAAAIIAFGDAVFGHVQRCFTREKILIEQIESAMTLKALLDIDINDGWEA